MKQSFCGADCAKCNSNMTCKGCRSTGGKPFGEPCFVAKLCQEENYETLREQLLAAFRALGIEELKNLNRLYPLKGSFVNLEYPLPSGQKITLWKDDGIYLGNQIAKSGSDRCYGVAADENYLAVSEYGENGADARLVMFKRWRQ